VVSAWGVAGGGLVHVGAAAVGLSSLLVSSATAFSVVKYAGAAYLFYLGVRRLLARESLVFGADGPMRSERVLIRDGFVVNVLNPKTALFFYAFLPQFLDPGRGSVALQALVLGAIFVAIALVSDSVWAVAAGSAAGWLRARPRVVAAERFVSGGVFLSLGAATALAGAHQVKS
jgi:threonine/homoserine/homoserine lactone efflux protein